MPFPGNCLYCQAPFVASSREKKFCSHACYSANKRRRIACICEHCGADFETIPAEVRKNVNGARFCSRACYRAAAPFKGEGSPRWKGGTRSVVCTNCGGTFERPLTWPKGGERTYCSATCRAQFLRANPHLTPNWKGGVTADDPRKSWEYAEFRKAVLKRDGYACQQCGTTDWLTVHHLYTYAEFPHLRHNPRNGLTLCESCHRAIKGKEAAFLESIGLDPARPPLL